MILHHHVATVLQQAHTDGFPAWTALDMSLALYMVTNQYRNHCSSRISTPNPPIR